ncbi:PepSY domain-containing protein [Novosphingobium album (ex Liu et al. 2023)]|uniref:PepSY domain-containing protein n=1 Tax=Novosphingobium album (ex Liu et al. 2023) TaxID=3031130 RepID=A0ABT5WMB2_9SPHN|nr:PepSY domain-containing protein [Novosphingobium album (ex Liu et al. 2023)]MDE8651189.1 PepSY domain-containing protein [Novosphingobium album (ex Liu et al. 2023)]
MRLVHHWTSLAVLLTGGLVAVTGVLLLLKKDVDWLQPPVEAASRTGAAQVRVDALFNAASNAAPQPLSWSEIDRIDVRPVDGIAKVITEDALEYQVDLHTLEVLNIDHRGADIVEKIHDGTFFASWVKYYLMLPSGIALLILWLTGVYLFFLTQFQKWRNKRR